MDNQQFNLEEKKLCFDAFVEEYKEKPLKEKQRLIINDLKEILASTQQLCLLYKINYDLLINREIVDANSESCSEDDFAEAVYVYLQMFKDIFASFLIPIIDEEKENQN